MRHDYARIWVMALAVLLFLLPSGLAAEAGENEPGETSESQSVRVLVAYYSLHGNTERFAQSVAEGAKRVPNTVVTIKKVKDVSKKDLQAANAIALGSATYFANMFYKHKLSPTGLNPFPGIFSPEPESLYPVSLSSFSNSRIRCSARSRLSSWLATMYRSPLKTDIWMR